MKKILLSILMGCTLLLVACNTSNGTPTVNIQNIEINSNVLEADFKIKVDYTTDVELMELITSAANYTYNHYKQDFGTKTFTLYFTVYPKDSETMLGVITYKVNSSLSNPGLMYIGDNLS